MRDDLPYSHQEEAGSLTPDGYVELFKIDLVTSSPQSVFITAKDSRTWQGNTYDSVPCTITASALNSTGEVSRPKFTVANPNATFSSYAESGELNNAIVTRYRVLRADYENDVNAFITNVWRVSRIVAVTRDVISCELRSVLDGQMFMLPGRKFYPPDFPHVSLY